MDPLTGESAALDVFLSDSAKHIVAHLGQNAIDWEEPYPVLADLVECTFPGYGAQNLNDWEVFEGEDELIGEGLSLPITWKASGIVAPQSAYYAYLTCTQGAGAPTLAGIFPLVPAFPFLQQGDSLEYQFRATSTPTPDEVGKSTVVFEMEEARTTADEKGGSAFKLILSRRRTARKALETLTVISRQDMTEQIRSDKRKYRPTFVQGDDGSDDYRAFQRVIRRLTKMVKAKN